MTQHLLILLQQVLEYHSYSCSFLTYCRVILHEILILYNIQFCYQIFNLLLNQIKCLLYPKEEFFQFFLCNHNSIHLHILLLYIYLQMNGIKFQKDNLITKIYQLIELLLHLQLEHPLFHFKDKFYHKYLIYIKVYLHQLVLKVNHF